MGPFPRLRSDGRRMDKKEFNEVPDQTPAGRARPGLHLYAWSAGVSYLLSDKVDKDEKIFRPEFFLAGAAGGRVLVRRVWCGGLRGTVAGAG